jgi:hypothetical protein
MFNVSAKIVATSATANHRQSVWLLAWWSIGWGTLLAVGEIARNFGDWQWWPFWVGDLIASALLIAGGWFALRPGSSSRLSPLVGALGFCTAGGYDSFFGHLASLDEPVNGPIPHVMLTAIIGLLFALAVLTFAAALVIAVRSERSANGA